MSSAITGIYNVKNCCFNVSIDVDSQDVIVVKRKKVAKSKILSGSTDQQSIHEGLRILARMIANSIYHDSNISANESNDDYNDRPFKKGG